MDKLRAYEILRLEPGSSMEEIKEAYAALSKEFHPEEHPEEFQLIHEAYAILRRGERRSGRSVDFGEVREETELFSMEETSYHFLDNIEIAESKSLETTEELNFDASLHHAEQEELFQESCLIVEALSEMQNLLTPKKKNKLKLFQAYFKKAVYQPIFSKPDYLMGLADLLKSTKLKGSIYDCIIDFYRLRGRDPEELIPSARILYDVLYEKCGMKSSKLDPAVYAIPGCAAAMVNALKPLARTDNIVLTAIWFAVFATFVIWVYRKTYKNHSKVFAQALAALFLILLSLCLMATEFYKYMFGLGDAGIVIVVIVMVLALLWLCVLGFIWLVKKLLKR